VADVDAILSLWILAGLKVEPGQAARELGGMLAAGTDLVLVAERGCSPPRPGAGAASLA
jgi:hypothetical protein